MDLNCKGLLQNFCQKIKAELPRYNCAQRVQDKHPLFLATVLAMGRNFASEGEFSNKKQAEKSAAYVALRELGILPEEKTKDFEPSAAEGQGSGTQGTSQDGKNSNNTTSKEEHPLLSSSPNGTIVLSPSNSQQPSASSCGSNVSFKNVLQERAQKMGLALPHYETESLGSGFVCTVTFNGQCYKSECFSPNKKHAQQSAACVALNLFSTERSECIESPGGTRNTPVVFENPCAVVKAAGVSYKNLLQEHCQQRGYKPPAYTTVWKGSGFSCTVHFGTQTSSFMGLCISNKKQAEQMAAREALLAIGITNPEEYLKNRPTRKNKSRRNLPKRFAPTGGLSRTSWVHPHAARDYDYYDYSWGDVDYYWEQSISRKRAHFDLDDPAPEKTSKLEVETFDLPMEHRRDLTVAELWKEKKSIAIVGHSESSFILYCTRVPGTCNLFNTRTMSLVSLEPGCRIIGLDARYVDLHGKVALQAERCADIIIPQIPDPVLTSCGVVLLYQDPQQNSIQVLLKRYLSSQAFVNVAAALAQYFRHQISGRVACLDITCLTEHIRDWMQQEVKNIATMNAAALRKVFAYMWKFNERWCAILEPPLPLDLQKLKATALDELSRRQASDVQHSEDFYHPWSLPKGNFKHRMLSTGLFIEPPIDCAVRELKEETGIKLDASELKNCPWIDLPQPDNFYNPHKGDMVRYFLYVYRPNTTDEDIKPLHQAENENSFDEEAAFFPKFPSLDSSTEEEAVEQETLGTCNNPYAEIDTQNTSEPETNVEDDSREVDAEKNKNPATLLHDAQSSEENNNNPAMLSRSGSTIVKRFIRQCVSGGTDMDLEQRGIKRKRDDDNDDDDDNIPFETSVEKPTTSTFHEQCQSAIETPTNSQEVITAKSPHVQGGVHEECSWFLVDEARIKSPAFKQVYQTWQFQDILLSVSKGET